MKLTSENAGHGQDNDFTVGSMFGEVSGLNEFPNASEQAMTFQAPRTKRKTRFPGRLISLAVAGVVLFGFIEVPAAEAGVSLQFEHRLSDFENSIPSLWARVDVEPEFGEVYSLNVGQGLIQIFNDAGMQIHSCGEEYSLRSAVDIAVGAGGEAFILFSRNGAGEILHLDYRGGMLGRISLRDLPKEVHPFHASYIALHKGRIYLADGSALRVAVLDAEGRFLEIIDLRAQLMVEEEKALEGKDVSETKKKMVAGTLEALSQSEMNGFSVDREGTIYFTLPTLFSAYRKSPEGKVEVFGKAGGAPGKFGVVAGIEADAEGNIYVADRLRCVVLVFDRDLNFLTEVGYRGDAPHNLVVPDDLAIDSHNRRLYVSQAANLGVSVFSIQVN